MQKLTSMRLLSFAIATAYQVQAQTCFTPEFRKVWDSYAFEELQEEYALYHQFLEDRCQRLSERWARSFKNVRIGIMSPSWPAGLSVVQ
ncbi:MAG: hypothetical protein LBG98_01120 [Puniceicoccales bacterium]|nr:hypothetical protein [Puniceicoccales bacterium]